MSDEINEQEDLITPNTAGLEVIPFVALKAVEFDVSKWSQEYLEDFKLNISSSNEIISAKNFAVNIQLDTINRLVYEGMSREKANKLAHIDEQYLNYIIEYRAFTGSQDDYLWVCQTKGNILGLSSGVFCDELQAGMVKSTTTFLRDPYKGIVFTPNLWPQDEFERIKSHLGINDLALHAAYGPTGFTPLSGAHTADLSLVSEDF